MDTQFKGARANSLLRLSVILTAIGLWSDVAAQTAQPGPNFLVVLFDDVGFMDIGAYGSDTRTPNIDALAKRGVMFSRFHSSPFCGPSRAMILTGRDNHQVGMGTLVETVSPEMRKNPGYTMLWNEGQPTIASLLSSAGYSTYVTGKWGIGETGANLPNRFGFDRSYVMDATGGSNYDAKPYLPGYDNVSWFEDGKPVTLPEDYYSSRNLVDKMISYIDDGDQTQPFFGFLSLQAVHIPVQVPKPYIDAYNGVFDAGWDEMRRTRLERAKDLGLVPSTTKLSPAPKTHRAWNDLTPEQKANSAREMQVNAGMVTAADEHIGRLLDHLESTGRLENTVVIITSDNGAEAAKTKFEGLQDLVVQGIELIEGFDTSPENLGQQNSLTAIGPEWASVSSAPFNLYKFYSSEGGLRVPLIASGPGIEATGILSQPIHVADLVPTILDAAGVTYDAKAFYGRSAYPIFTMAADRIRSDDEGFGFEVSGNAAYYQSKWKITRLAPPLGDGKWRLYDLDVDPGEVKDLSKEEPAIFEEMLAAYEAYANDVGVVELGPGESASKQLFENVTKKALNKYWPYLIGVILVLLGAVYLAFRMIRSLLRHRTSRSRTTPEA